MSEKTKFEPEGFPAREYYVFELMRGDVESLLRFLNLTEPSLAAIWNSCGISVATSETRNLMCGFKLIELLSRSIAGENCLTGLADENPAELTEGFRFWCSANLDLVSKWFLALDEERHKPSDEASDLTSEAYCSLADAARRIIDWLNSLRDEHKLLADKIVRMGRRQSLNPIDSKLSRALPLSLAKYLQAAVDVADYAELIVTLSGLPSSLWIVISDNFENSLAPAILGLIQAERQAAWSRREAVLAYPDLESRGRFGKHDAVVQIGRQIIDAVCRVKMVRLSQLEDEFRSKTAGILARRAEKLVTSIGFLQLYPGFCFWLGLCAQAEAETSARDLQNDNASTIVPVWRKADKELRYNGKTVRRVASLGKAPNIVCILDAFEEAGWPQTISDPIDKGDQARRDAIESLNESLSDLRFSGDGDKNIQWELCCPD